MYHIYGDVSMAVALNNLELLLFSYPPSPFYGSLYIYRSTPDSSVIYYYYYYYYYLNPQTFSDSLHNLIRSIIALLISI